MKQLGYTDSVFVSLETATSPQHVASVGIYDPSTAPGGVVRFKEVLANFEERLRELPHFRTRLVQVPGRLDRPYWVVDEEFDVEYHIRHLALPQPGDWRQFCIQIARIHARPMDMQRPMWECYVIEGLNNVEGCPPGSFAVYMKYHHCMIDGDLGQRIIEVTHDLEPVPPKGKRVRAKVGIEEDFDEPVLGDAELVVRALSNRVRNLVPNMRAAARVLWQAGDTALKISRGEMAAPIIGPKTRFDEPIGPHRVWEGMEFSLAEMKQVTRSAEVTLNDLVMAVVSGGLRRYLQHHGELPRESVVVNVPVNMRKRGRETGENNQISALMPALRTDVADPRERLYAVRDSMVAAKQHIGTPLSEPLKLVGVFPPFLAKPMSRAYAKGRLTRFLPAGTPCVVTNVPGPRVALYANGARLSRMFTMGLLTPGVGLFHSIFSLGDSVTLSVIADRDQMPDPAFYKQCLQESYAELRDLFLKPARKKPARKKPARKKAARKKAAKATAARKAAD